MSYKQALIEERKDLIDQFTKLITSLKVWIKAHQCDRMNMDLFNTGSLDDLEADIVSVLEKEIEEIEEKTDDDFTADYYIDLAREAK